MPLFEADYEFETELLKLMCGIPGICGFDILAKDITNSFGGSLNEAELPDYEGPWYNGSETWNDTPAADAVVSPSASSAGVSSSSAFNDPVRGGTRNLSVVPGQFGGQGNVTPSGAFEYSLPL